MKNICRMCERDVADGQGAVKGQDYRTGHDVCWVEWNHRYVHGKCVCCGTEWAESDSSRCGSCGADARYVGYSGPV